jgi:hypothetical protein
MGYPGVLPEGRSAGSTCSISRRKFTNYVALTLGD